MRQGIVDGLKDILNAQIQHVVRAAESKEWEASVSDDINNIHDNGFIYLLNLDYGYIYITWLLYSFDWMYY